MFLFGTKESPQIADCQIFEINLFGCEIQSLGGLPLIRCQVQNVTMDFGSGNEIGKFHSQISGMGMRVENSITNFREWECKWKIHS